MLKRLKSAAVVLFTAADDAQQVVTINARGIRPKKILHQCLRFSHSPFFQQRLGLPQLVMLSRSVWRWRTILRKKDSRTAERKPKQNGDSCLKGLNN